MKITVKFNYTDKNVMLPRKRKPQDVRREDGLWEGEIREISTDDAPVVLRVESPRISSNEPRSIMGETTYRLFEGQLWTPFSEPRRLERWPEPKAEYVFHSDTYLYRLPYRAWVTKEENVAAFEYWAKDMILVDGILHRTTFEPYWRISLTNNYQSGYIWLEETNDFGPTESSFHLQFYFSIDDLAGAIERLKGQIGELPENAIESTVYISNGYRPLRDLSAIKEARKLVEWKQLLQEKNEKRDKAVKDLLYHNQDIREHIAKQKVVPTTWYEFVSYQFAKQSPGNPYFFGWGHAIAETGEILWFEDESVDVPCYAIKITAPHGSGCESILKIDSYDLLQPYVDAILAEAQKYSTTPQTSTALFRLTAYSGDDDYDVVPELVGFINREAADALAAVIEYANQPS